MHISHGCRPPKYCDPTAPPSSASGTSNAMSRAAAAAERLPERREPMATASAMPRLLLLLDRRLHRSSRGDRHRPAQPLQRIHRVVELEVLDALLLQVLGLCREP